MDWNNLKDNKCPKCSYPLTESDSKMHMYCINCTDFFIKKEKFDEVVNSLYKPKRKRYNAFDNMEALNNL